MIKQKILTGYSLACISSLLVYLLTGCATSSKTFNPVKKTQSQVTKPECSNDQDCEKKWNAAKIWVSHHAGYPIVKATDTLIETEASKDKSLSIRVSKLPLGNNTYQLFVEVTCANLTECSKNIQDTILNFNTTISEI